MNDGDVFVLEAMSHIFIWVGSSDHHHEQKQIGVALGIPKALYDARRLRSASIISGAACTKVLYSMRPSCS